MLNNQLILVSREGSGTVVRNNCYIFVPWHFSDIFVVTNDIWTANKEIHRISTILLTPPA